MSTRRLVHAVRRRLRVIAHGHPKFAPVSPSPTAGRFVILGDLQRTSLLELWRESNERERHRLVAAVAAERPDFVIMLGDLVFQGDSRIDWLEFDELTAPLREGGIPVLPVVGNHDYGFRASLAMRHLHARFPGLAGATYGTTSYGPVALVTLDSNFRRMGDVGLQAQARWLPRELDRLERDPRVRAVLLFAHHPPFTNSRVSADDRSVRRAFLPPLFAHSKACAMVSGHVHSYERFSRSGKSFVVSGGGGAPRAAVRDGARRRHTDDLFRGPIVRPFHYLRCELGEDAVNVDVRGFEFLEDPIATFDGFTWALAPPEAVVEER